MNTLLKKENIKPLWAIDRAVRIAPRKGVLGELLYFVAFFAFCLKFTLDYSGLIPERPEMLNTMLVALSISCSMAKILMQRYTPLRFVMTMIICAAIGFSAVISTNFLFLLSFLLVVSMQDIELEKIVQAGFLFKVVSIAVHVIIYIFVFHTNPDVIEFNFRAGTGEPRHFFFMGHSNTFTAFLIWSCFDYIYLKYDKLNIFRLATMWVIAVTFFMFTRSNTAMIVFAVITVFVFADKMRKGYLDRLFTFFAKYLYIIFSLFFTLLIVTFTQLQERFLVLWYALDDFMTGRLWLAAHTFYTEGHTILGRPDMPPRVVFWRGRWFDTMTIMDNHYLGNFVSYGIINTVAVAAALIALCGKMETREKLIIIAFSLFAIMQNDVTNIVICFALLILGKHIYTQEHRPT